MRKAAYEFTPGGIAFRDADGALGPTLGDVLAVLYDREEEVLLRHGSAEVVAAAHERLAGSLSGTTLAKDLGVLHVPVAEITTDLLATINRGVGAPGTLGGLINHIRDALGIMRDQRPPNPDRATADSPHPHQA